ncbi:MAG: NAD(P)/FAD-dependent oxidoreductase [Acidimicrobiia bacterium]|nr:NAD(P)/FAD-dependent oxidoreductase [Acidimicrobiia bacterium]
MGDEHDVIVIGAGPGGASIAALLAEAGLTVLLTEKNDRAGGKAMTLHRQGYGYEMWPVIAIPGGPSRYDELLKRIRREDDVPLAVPPPELSQAGGIVYHTDDGRWLRMVASTSDNPLDSFAQTFDLTPEEMQPVVDMAMAVFALSEDEIDALGETPILAWLSGFGLPAGPLAYIGVMLNMFFLVGPDRIPASEAIRICLRGFMLAGGEFQYWRGGIGRTLEVAAEYVTEHGGTFVTKAKVERIIVEGGRAVGVVTPQGEFRARAVISNAGIQPTVLQLAGESHFPPEYVDYVRDLEPSWGIAGIRYFLDASVFPPAGLAFGDLSWWTTDRYEQARAGDWPDIPQLYWSTPALWDPGLAPQDGSQVVLIGTLADPDPDSPMSEEAIRRIHETALEAWPALGDHITRQEPYTTRSVSTLTRDAAVPGAGGECIGIAQTIEQEGKNKPNPRTPLAGLYIVGCDAGGRGVATHQAVDSGFRVADLVLADLGVPPRA